MKIIEVDSELKSRQWHLVPRLIYASDPNWIPHLKQDVEKIFNPKKNKFFRDGQVIRWMLQDDQDQVIGRIAAFTHPKINAGHKHKTGGLGFLECTDDSSAAKILIEKAIEWLLEKGMEAVDGPINFGERDAFWGLLIENFTDMSSYRMNYNPPYYQRFFEENGFQIYFEQLCYKRDLYVPAQEVFVRKTNQLMLDSGYRCANTRGRSDEEMAKDFLEVYNNAWGGFAGFKTMQIQQARSIVKSMKPVMDRDIMIFAYHNDKPIGFYLNLPELNEFFQHIDGNLNLIGKLKFLFYSKFAKRKTMVGIIFGVDRAYHGKGVEGALIKWAEENVVTLKRYDETIMTWIGDFNPKMMKVAENLGASVYRRLATYHKIFDPSIPFERCPEVR